MHVSRGGWVGQTCALAKFNDSYEGKKTGIRHSKEERKGMVEIYIKRYQKLNNGDFPSLNLTRKEVGGSFYTVREIVREIIQENRVLGPPKTKTPPGDENMDNLNSSLENYPLGPISVDLCVHPEETQLSEYEFINENVTNTQSITEIHQGNNEEFERSKNSEILLMEGGIREQKDKLVVNQTEKHKVLEDVEVTSTVVDGDLEESDIENRELATGNNNHLVCNNVNDITDVKLEDTLLTEEKALVNGAIGQNLHSKTSCSSVQQPTVGERSANLNKSSDQPRGNSQNRSANATLNRINLESWKATSKKINDREIHPLVKFIRSSIAAFVKFWSE